MKRTLMVSLALVACCALFAQPAAADSPFSTDRSRVSQAPTFGLEFDMITGEVWRIPTNSRTIINSSFVMTQAQCVTCGTGCPIDFHFISVRLEAVESIPGGYGTSNMFTQNFSMTGIPPHSVTLSRTDALIAGNELVVNIIGSALTCGPTFKVYFSICDINPFDPFAECPGEPR